MAKIYALAAIALMGIGAAPVRTVDDICPAINTPRLNGKKAVLYVHNIGPDYLWAFDVGCPSKRIEQVDFSRAAKDEIFHVIERSDEGYSVAYDTEILWDARRRKSVAYLIKRNEALNEIEFRPPPPPPEREE